MISAAKHCLRDCFNLERGSDVIVCCVFIFFTSSSSSHLVDAAFCLHFSIFGVCQSSVVRVVCPCPSDAALPHLPPGSSFSPAPLPASSHRPIQTNNNNNNNMYYRKDYTKQYHRCILATFNVATILKRQ